MAVSRFEELVAWRRARELAVAVYRATSTGRFSRDFGLRDQIQRAAVSVVSNLAEGFGRFSRAEFRQFVSIARGSAAEVRSQLYVALDLGYVQGSEFRRLLERAVELDKLLSSLHSALGRPRR